MENNAGTMRLFIAVELPEAAKQGLTRIQESLKRSCPRCPARWVSPENTHLTLNFLGDVDASRLPDVKEAVTQTSTAFEGFELALGDVGAFPSLERPRVLWVGMRGDMNRLTLSALGFAPEARPFSPHLTLARVGDEVFSADRKRLGEAAAALTCSTDCAVAVHRLSLIRSQLTPGGPVYTVLIAPALRNTV